MPHHKKADKGLAGIQKSIVLATTVVRIADEFFFAEKDFRSSDLRSIMGHIVGHVTLLTKFQWQMSGDRKEQLKLLCEACVRNSTSSEFLFVKTLKVESMMETKETFKM